MTEPGASFTSIDPAADYFHLLRRELGVTSFGINQLILQPRQRLRVHRHERQEEVYLVLEGELTLIVEGDSHRLGVGDLARVGPELKRQLTNPGAVKTIVLALGGAGGEHQSRDGIAWSGWDDEGEGRPPKEVPLPDDLPG